MAYDPKPAHRVVPPGPTKRRREELRLAREEGASEALSEFLPLVVENVRQRQELQPKVFRLLDECLSDDRSPDQLSALTTLMKALFDSDKWLVDRVMGSSVQRSESKVQAQVTVGHVSLRDLVARQRGQELEGEIVD